MSSLLLYVRATQRNAALMRAAEHDRLVRSARNSRSPLGRARSAVTLLLARGRRTTPTTISPVARASGHGEGI